MATKKGEPPARNLRTKRVRPVVCIYNHDFRWFRYNYSWSLYRKPRFSSVWVQFFLDFVPESSILAGLDTIIFWSLYLNLRFLPVWVQFFLEFVPESLIFYDWGTNLKSVIDINQFLPV